MRWDALGCYEVRWDATAWSRGAHLRGVVLCRSVHAQLGSLRTVYKRNHFALQERRRREEQMMSDPTGGRSSDCKLATQKRLAPILIDGRYRPQTRVRVKLKKLRSYHTPKSMW
jgi:hypothetical protein